MGAHHRLDAGGRGDRQRRVRADRGGAFGVFPWAAALSIIVANYIFKVSIEVLFTPVTYRVVDLLKRAEGVDYYDVNTDFNPFRVNA